MPLHQQLQAALGSSYAVERELGGGGMSRVFVASELRLGRLVVVKVLPPELATGLSAERFRREMQFVAQLQHPHIVPLLTAAEGEGLVYYTMPYIDGESLRHRLVTDGRVPVREALEIAAEVADALAYAHRSGVIHRDVKPENILISAGHAMVADFGIARALSAAGGTDAFTASAIRVGTPAYMSPEQALGEDLDARTDIYSLGCVLYEMVAGCLPFPAGNAQAMLAHRLLGPPSSVRIHGADAPAVLDEVLERVLAPDPNDRFATSFEFFEALRTVLTAPDGTTREATGERKSHAHTGSGRAPATNLPLPPTPLVGRQQELESVVRRLRDDDIRLITITGPGGVGKTRLAIEVARALLPGFRDGVFIVPLADTTDPGRLGFAIGHAIGVEGTDTTLPMRALCAELGSRQVLLLLDNFEQLLAAASEVGELLAAAPGVKIIVTSQAPLRIRAEHEFALKTLSMPVSTVVSASELRTYGAVQLFLQRARAADSGFSPSADDLRAVAEICARLDGLPLAIELAAARTKMLPPRLLVTRVRSGLELLPAGAKDLPARQQTIRAAIEWSFKLLDPAEQTLLMQLAVFSGGCTIEAAEAVCLREEKIGGDVLGVMASLVDKSLLAVDDQARLMPRFTLLQAIRHFGLEQLGKAGAGQVVRERHAEFFVALATTAEPHLVATDSDTWLDALEAEHENFRAALDHLIAERKDEALRLAIALWRFWNTRGFVREGLERMVAALEVRGAQAAPELRTKALYAAGVLADTAGDYERGRRLFEDALAVFRRRGDKWGVANSLNNLGVLAMRRGDHAAARLLYEESLALWREVHNRPVVALSLSNLGNVAMSDGDFARAESLYRESLEVFRGLGDGNGIALALSHLGDLERARGRLDEAGKLYEESLAIYEAMGDKSGAASAASDRGDTAIDAGDAGLARQFLEAALSLFGDLGDRLSIVRVLERFAALAASQGHAARAVQLLAAAEAERKRLGATTTEHEQGQLDRRVAPSAKSLGEAETAMLREGGSTMSLEQAITLALG